MYFSRQTLTDCQIIPHSPEAIAISTLFDFTETEGGAASLKEILKTKLLTRKDIVERQTTLDFIAKRPDLCELKLNRFDLRYLHEYLRSNFGRLSGSLAVEINYKLNVFGIRQQISFVKSGLILVQRLLTTLRQLVERIDSVATGWLKNKAQRMLAMADQEMFSSLQQATLENTTARYISKLDYQFRFEGKLPFQQLLDEVYELDALFSLGRAIRVYQLKFPQVVDHQEALNIQMARNLFIKEAVPTSFKSGQEKRFVFLSGPNMAGKSSFLRTIGLIVCLAHIGMAVPADHAEIPFYDEIEVHINSQDNPAQGYSHFYNEILKIKSLLTSIESGRRCFFVFDEIFKGTNLADATACAEILFAKMSAFKQIFGFVSSHHTELLKNANPISIQFMYLQVHMAQNHPVFTYKLMDGISDITLGIYLFRQVGI